MTYTYLLIDLFSISLPFIFSFHPKLRFDKKWNVFWPACFISAAIFIGWDILYTNIGVWGFNENYLTGLNLFNLPIEEVLFFICIPYSCLFTYHCLKILSSYKMDEKTTKIISISLLIFLGLVALLNWKNLYTSVTFISLALFIFYLKFISNSAWLGQFYRLYLIILFPFFIVNGILTGSWIEEPIVWYNNAENLGIRLLTIPIEDIFYGMLLILLNVFLYESFILREQRVITKKGVLT